MLKTYFVPLSDIIVKLLQRDPEKRYKNIKDVILALTELEAPEATPIEEEVPRTRYQIINDIGYAILEAKNLFYAEYNVQAALDTLKAIINKYKYRSLNVKFLSNAYSWKAFFHNYLQEWDKAITEASNGIKVDPNHCESYIGRGYAYKRKGTQNNDPTLLEKAKVDFNKAILLSPNNRKRLQAQRYLGEVSSILSSS